MIKIKNNIETKPSVCPLDCPDTCSLSVKTNGTRVLEVRGSKANPYTAGVICNKVMRAFPDFVHGANRLTNPLKLVGPRGSGQFEIISWDKALDLVHEGFTSAIRKYGSQTVMPLNYAGPHGSWLVAPWTEGFFTSLVQPCSRVANSVVLCAGPPIRAFMEPCPECRLSRCDILI